jgi:hypothetical protein
MLPMSKERGLTLDSEIEGAGELGSRVDDLRLDDVVKDGVDACRWD